MPTDIRILAWLDRRHRRVILRFTMFPNPAHSIMDVRHVFYFQVTSHPYQFQEYDRILLGLADGPVRLPPRSRMGQHLLQDGTWA